MKDIAIAAVITVIPALLHLRMLLGHFILEPVRSFGGPLNALFNRIPAASSIAGGTLSASAYLWRSETSMAFAMGSMAFVVLAFDFLASLESFQLSVRKRR